MIDAIAILFLAGTLTGAIVILLLVGYNVARGRYPVASLAGIVTVVLLVALFVGAAGWVR